MEELDRCDESHAEKFLDWFKNRGGVAVWLSQDFSDPGAKAYTPAMTADKPTEQPNWKYSKKPEYIITDPSKFIVIKNKEVKRFHIAIRRGAQGLKLKLTDASSKRLRKEVDKAGKDAFYAFDYDTQEAVILVPETSTPLSEWKNQGP